MGQESPQERLLHDVVRVVWIPAQPRREGARRPEVPLNQELEPASVTGARLPDQIPVADVHTSKCRRRAPRLPSGAATHAADHVVTGNAMPHVPVLELLKVNRIGQLPQRLALGGRRSEYAGRPPF